MKFIDLTHTLSSTIPFWDGTCGFTLSKITDYSDCIPPNIFRTQKINMNAGVGTHMDAPAHCLPGGKTIDELELGELIIDCIVIRVEKEAHETYTIMPSVVEQFEKYNGEIPPNSLVIFYTGWDKYWNEPEKFINNYRFPSVDVSTAELLLKRGVSGLGTDTISVDTGAAGFPVHRAILGDGKYLVENIANAGELPPTGAKILILPMKIEKATEAPIRLIALI